MASSPGGQEHGQQEQGGRVRPGAARALHESRTLPEGVPWCTDTERRAAGRMACAPSRPPVRESPTGEVAHSGNCLSHHFLLRLLTAGRQAGSAASLHAANRAREECLGHRALGWHAPHCGHPTKPLRESRPSGLQGSRATTGLPPASSAWQLARLPRARAPCSAAQQADWPA